jgi:hypothetical protein
MARVSPPGTGKLMRHAAWVLAFHGCDRKIGERILAGKEEILPSTNPYDWLGGGAYFWENSQARAFSWATFLKDHPGVANAEVKEPFVLGAIIDSGYCLDLTAHESLATLKVAYTNFEETLRSLDIPLPRNESSHASDMDLVKRKLDCAVINHLHDIREARSETPFDTVRCPFTEGRSLFPGSKIPDKNHIQWCVRDPAKSVLGYFRPRGRSLE